MFNQCCQPSKCRANGFCSCSKKYEPTQSVERTQNDYDRYNNQSFAHSSIGETNGTFVDQPPKNARMLKPLVQERIVEVLKPEIEEKIIEVPQVQYVEKIVEVPQIILQEKLIHVPKPVIHERIRKCPKPIFHEKIVEVPQIKVVDKIVEVPEYVYQEKIIEVPKVMVQERIIPVPRKVIKEKIVEIPQIELRNMNIEKTLEEPEYIPEYVKKDVPYTQVMDRPFHVEKIVEVPHVQHIYRNIVSPQYRHIPKPVEVPMAHYRTFPVEKLVDRNVPVPVEIQIVQEFLCPKIEARYKEIPVPVHVQRIIEHPIPKDAMNNPHILPLYYQEDNLRVTGQNQVPNNKGCFMFNCGKKTNSQMGGSTSGLPPIEMMFHPDKNNRMNMSMEPQAFQNNTGRIPQMSPSGGDMNKTIPMNLSFNYAGNQNPMNMSNNRFYSPNMNNPSSNPNEIHQVNSLSAINPPSTTNLIPNRSLNYANNRELSKSYNSMNGSMIQRQ